MSKIISKLQVTLPKALADRFGIGPGDHIDWEVAGDTIRVIPAARRRGNKTGPQAQLRLFDQATRRQQERDRAIDPLLLQTAEAGRGWTRQDLYSCNTRRVQKTSSRNASRRSARDKNNAP